MPLTLYEKIWAAHVIEEIPDGPSIIYIDRHLIHEVTSPQAFSGLVNRGIMVRCPEKTSATVDHSIPTTPRSQPITDIQAKTQIHTLGENCKAHGVTLYDVESGQQGIVHVIGPELGLTLPGQTIVCGDSHTSTHGAFGALAFGIGTSEVELVLASQCLLQTPSKTMEVRVDGELKPGVTAKDVILYIIGKLGVGGANGHVIEYTGSAITGLSMEGRMTVCNMSIEAGARAGLIAPDQTTVDFLRGRTCAPGGSEAGDAFDKAVAEWLSLKTDDGATYDRQIVLKAQDIEPMVTYGTNPGMAMGISQAVPAPMSDGDDDYQAALDYMKLHAGQPIAGTAIDVAFIGSCTNSRMEDLRAAAQVIKGRQINPRVRGLVVPGSEAIKVEAESENLHTIFTDAGFEWREPGCSMCIAMNGDMVEPGMACASTSNRNFKGRQGKGSRTFLMSPAMAAAAAIEGALVDVRQLQEAGA